MTSGIYLITNKVDMKQYIGSAKNIQARFVQHRRGYHSSSYLQNAIKKYGLENFEFDALEECSFENCVSAENYFIKLFRPEYNIAPIAGHPPSTLGLKFKMSEKALRKMTLRMLGNKNAAGAVRSKETRQKLSKAGKARQLRQRQIGYFISQETRDKISESLKGNQRAKGHIPWNKKAVKR